MGVEKDLDLANVTLAQVHKCSNFRIFHNTQDRMIYGRNIYLFARHRTKETCWVLNCYLRQKTAELLADHHNP